MPKSKTPAATSNVVPLKRAGAKVCVASNVAPVASSKLSLDLAQRMALGTRLTELREDRGLSQMQVADQALGFKVSHAAVSRLERGVLPVVEDDRLEKLAAFYGETVQSLLDEINVRREDQEPDEFRSVDGLVVAPCFGARLFNLRQSAGLTVHELAKLLAYHSQSTILIRQWEREEVVPRPATLLNIAVALGVSASWLITGKRAKPVAPTFGMRLRAMQKLYGLSTREVATLSGLDMERGRRVISRAAYARHKPEPETVTQVAKALDVPESWILPPTQGYEKAELPEQAPRLDISDQANQFLTELGDLFAMSAITDIEVSGLRKRFMKELMDGLRQKKAA